MSKAAYKKITVPKGLDFTMVGFMAARSRNGNRNRVPRAHILHCKHEAERANWKWSGACNLKAHPQRHNSIAGQQTYPLFYLIVCECMCV